MNDIEKRARELLSDELEKVSFPSMAAEVRDEDGENTVGQVMVRVVAAAITPLEGYVLVPVDPTPEMMEAAARVVFREAGQEWTDPAEFAARFVIETQRLCHAAMLAARPEVHHD